jgi:hypothetical protein
MRLHDCGWIDRDKMDGTQRYVPRVPPAVTDMGVDAKDNSAEIDCSVGGICE